MNAFGIIFMLVTAAAMLSLPRRWAILPLLMGACYITPTQALLVGPFHFTALRLLLLLGTIRSVTRHERLPGGLIGLDWLVIGWGVIDLCTAVFHKPFGDVLVFRLGLVYNAFGMYFLIRIFCQSGEDLIQLIKITAFLLVPVALEMVYEKLSARNLFGFLSGTSEEVLVRDGKLRANGPFGHAILAGTVGALCVPLIIGIWREHRRTAMIGLAACLTMIIASTSSGPIMTLAFGAFALVLWRWRHLTGRMRIAAVVGYILLDLVMKDPAYFLMARIDLTGSSTGWYRSQLIRSAFQHLNEWWFAGTDYTRHWMNTGLMINDTDSDIVNHYLEQGVSGGLMLMAITIGWFYLAFSYLGRSLRLRAQAPFAERFLIWSLGSGLFASAMTCFSVSYFEQSVMFLYLNLAAIASLYATAKEDAREKKYAVSDADRRPIDGEWAPNTGLMPDPGRLRAPVAAADIRPIGSEP